MKTNFFTLGQLVEKGHNMNMKQNMMKVYGSEKKLILKFPLPKNQTFRIDGW